MAYFNGYAVIEEKGDENRGEDSDFVSDSEDEFDTADFDFVHKPSRQLKQVVQNMRELQFKDGRFVSKGMTRVRGKFDRLFCYPWWMVQVNIHPSKKLSNNEKLACKLPSYSYRTDDDVGEDVLSLFLIKGCKVHQQHAEMLLDFIRKNNLRPTLNHLFENLETFAGSSEDNEAVAGQIKEWLYHSETGKAFSVPLFTKFAHRLFPRQVCSIFKDCSLEELESLNEAIQREPWEMGYWTILMKKYNLSGCEAKLASFAECDLLQRMPIDMQDALRIYDALSSMVRKYGHTYVYLWQLKQKQHDVTNWEKSLAYLSKIDAVKTSEDHLGDRRLVFLPYLRRFEQKIARNLADIMDKKPWMSNIEIDEEVFHGDEDQVKAGKLLTEKPVVVMSGRGGCGKTFVVSNVLTKALEMKKQRALQEFSDEENEDTVRMSDASDEEAKPCSFSGPDTAASARYVDHENISDKHTTEQELQKNLATSTGIPDSKGNTELCSESKSLSRRIEAKMKEIEGEVLLTAPTGKAASLLGKRTGLPSHTLHSVIYSCVYWEQEGKGDWKFSNVRLLVCDECSLISVRVFSKLINSLTKWSELQQVILLGDINQLPSIEPGNFLSDVFTTLEGRGVAVSLRTNHRSDSDLIVQNAVKISMKQLPVFDPLRKFVSVPYQSERNDNDSETNKVTKVVKNVLQSEELRDHRSSQFVAFRRSDCKIINEQCALHYNGHSIEDRQRKFDFRTGDKVCIRRNSECFDAYEKKSVKLCNGEIFFIADIIEEQDSQRKKKRVFFSLDNGDKIFKINYCELRAAKLTHAWARTIHTFQGSEIETIVYVVGHPYYQNWQHVYTAVTRGIRQVIIVNNPNYLEKAISTPPGQRQTKLREDMTGELEYRTMFWSDEDVGDLEDDAQVASPSGEEGNDGKTRAPEESSPVDESLPIFAESSVDFHISRHNLRIKKMEQEIQEQVSSTGSSTTDVTNAESLQELLQTTNLPRVDVLRSPRQKRKHPEAENADYLTPPQTPPALKNLPSSLLCVSPLSQEAARHTQEAVAAQPSTATPAKKKKFLARHKNKCIICNDMVNVGDEIDCVFEGSTKRWVHSECKIVWVVS